MLVISSPRMLLYTIQVQNIETKDCLSQSSRKTY
jgi:hypothetical protein